MSRQCIVCKKMVANTDVQEHLANNHLGPHYFWFNAKKYRTMEPSMPMVDLKRLANVPYEYQAFEEREGGDVYFGDSEAVDLTQGSHFWAAPPATMFG